MIINARSLNPVSLVKESRKIDSGLPHLPLELKGKSQLIKVATLPEGAKAGSTKIRK